MPILHIRNVPAPLYREMQRLAKRNRRSLSAEVVAGLEAILGDARRRERMARVLERLRRHREAMPALPPGVSSSDWIREARGPLGEG